MNGTMISQNQTVAKFMRSLDYKTWAVTHDTTDYEKGHNKFFSENLATYGVSADQQDFTAGLTKIKELNPDATYFG